MTRHLGREDTGEPSCLLQSESGCCHYPVRLVMCILTGKLIMIFVGGCCLQMLCDTLIHNRTTDHHLVQVGYPIPFQPETTGANRAVCGYGNQSLYNHSGNTWDLWMYVLHRCCILSIVSNGQ